MGNKLATLSLILTTKHLGQQASKTEMARSIKDLLSTRVSIRSGKSKIMVHYNDKGIVTMVIYECSDVYWGIRCFALEVERSS